MKDTTQQKKAVMFGGSNGIGLALSKKLIEKGYFVEICDRSAPEDAIMDSSTYCYHACDLLELNEEMVKALASDEQVEVLFITAGIGRIADFQFFHTAEIEKMLTVNTVSTIKILRLFYEKIMAAKPFFAGVMGSISGWMSSPSAAVYAASKASVVRFIESVNIELEVMGTSNRILDVSPSSFKGSRFYGGKNDLSVMDSLAQEIMQCLFTGQTKLIPQYDQTFKAVLERYYADPHEYGLHSYRYKQESGRQDNTRRVKIGYLSGTFDLFHVGHLNLLRRAKQQCDYLIVGVHDSGKWKGKETFVSLEERKAIVGACRYVDKVVDSCREDADAWSLWHYDRLFVGSDYKGSERFLRYEEYFKDKDVEIVYFPYTQSTSSTQLRKAIHQKTYETAEHIEEDNKGGQNA